MEIIWIYSDMGHFIPLLRVSPCSHPPWRGVALHMGSKPQDSNIDWTDPVHYEDQWDRNFNWSHILCNLVQYVFFFSLFYLVLFLDSWCTITVFCMQICLLTMHALNRKLFRFWYLCNILFAIQFFYMDLFLILPGYCK